MQVPSDPPLSTPRRKVRFLTGFFLSRWNKHWLLRCLPFFCFTSPFHEEDEGVPLIFSPEQAYRSTHYGLPLSSFFFLSGKERLLSVCRLSFLRRGMFAGEVSEVSFFFSPRKDQRSSYLLFSPPTIRRTRNRRGLLPPFSLFLFTQVTAFRGFFPPTPSAVGDRRYTRPFPVFSPREE